MAAEARQRRCAVGVDFGGGVDHGGVVHVGSALWMSSRAWNGEGRRMRGFRMPGNCGHLLERMGSQLVEIEVQCTAS